MRLRTFALQRSVVQPYQQQRTRELWRPGRLADSGLCPARRACGWIARRVQWRRARRSAGAGLGVGRTLAAAALVRRHAAAGAAQHAAARVVRGPQRWLRCGLLSTLQGKRHPTPFLGHFQPCCLQAEAAPERVTPVPNAAAEQQAHPTPEPGVFAVTRGAAWGRAPSPGAPPVHKACEARTGSRAGSGGWARPPQCTACS